MKEWLVAGTETAVVAIDAIAMLVIVFGTIEALAAGVRAVLLGSTGRHRRDIWLQYSRWLVAGLTFQLAADIIETSITTSWESVARLAAIAVIRTFLDVFLERDVEDVRKRQEQTRDTLPAR